MIMAEVSEWINGDKSVEIIVDEEALVLIQQGEHVIVPRQFICSFLEELNKTVARNAREAA